MPPTKRTIRILKEIKETLQTHFGEEIVEVILFGSRARGRAKSYSDYDLLILLRNPYDWEKKQQIREVLYLEIILKRNIMTDTHFLSLSELDTLRGKQPIFSKALQNGIYA